MGYGYIWMNFILQEFSGKYGALASRLQQIKFWRYGDYLFTCEFIRFTQVKCASSIFLTLPIATKNHSNIRRDYIGTVVHLHFDSVPHQTVATAHNSLLHDKKICLPDWIKILLPSKMKTHPKDGEHVRSLLNFTLPPWRPNTLESSCRGRRIGPNFIHHIAVFGVGWRRTVMSQTLKFSATSRLNIILSWTFQMNWKQWYSRM